MNKDVRLYNIVEKNGETRFIIVKAGCFYALNYDNISQLEDLFKRIKEDEAGLREEINKTRTGERI